MLETGTGRSAWVREFDPAFVETLFATRVALEALLVRLAAQRITAGQLRAVQRSRMS